MAKFNTNLADSEFDGKKIADQGNPLNGTVEENKAKFDAYPHAILMKLRAIVGELEEMFKNKDLSANDFTTELKEKLEGLENYDDGGLKDLIESSVAELEEKHDKDVTSLENSIENSIAQKIAELVGEAPETLDTLAEIAAALGGNANSVTEILRQLGTKADKEYVEGIEDRVIDFEGEMDEVQDTLKNKVVDYMGRITYDDMFLQYRGKEYNDGYNYVGIFSTGEWNLDEIGIFESYNVADLDMQRKTVFTSEGMKVYQREADVSRAFGEWELVYESANSGGADMETIKQYVNEQIGLALEGDY